MIKLPAWKRVVIKVGGALISPGGKRISTKYLLAIARLIDTAKDGGKEVILVSSGAVPAGYAMLPQLGNTRYIPVKQALAAVGQTQLMATWARFFDFPCAQMLLTHDDFRNRRRFVNAKNTLQELLKMGCLPIVNENDSVAVDELKLGDNDNLAAHVAVMAEADLLIILSDVDGLYNDNPKQNPEARLIAEVNLIDESIYQMAGGAIHHLATGGMFTKIQAAEKATSGGVHCVIAGGAKAESLDALMKGSTIGTIFHSRQNPISAKKHWLHHALRSKGVLVIDQGAAAALFNRGASLLPSGIMGVEGDFSRGEAVEVHLADQSSNQTGKRAVAKGITQYKAEDCRRIMGKQSKHITTTLGFAYSDVVIHRDDLVMLQSQKQR